MSEKAKRYEAVYLREAVDDVQSVGVVLATDYEALEREVERLRGLLGKVDESFDLPDASYSIEERFVLREIRQGFDHDHRFLEASREASREMYVLATDAAALEQEVERLTNLNIEQEQAHGCAMSAVEVWRGRAEEAERQRSVLVGVLDSLTDQIEELRTAVGLLTTLHPTMEMDSSDPVGMAQKIVACVALQNAVVEAGKERIAALVGYAGDEYESASGHEETLLRMIRSAKEYNAVLNALEEKR